MVLQIKTRLKINQCIFSTMLKVMVENLKISCLALYSYHNYSSISYLLLKIFSLDKLIFRKVSNIFITIISSELFLLPQNFSLT